MCRFWRGEVVSVKVVQVLWHRQGPKMGLLVGPSCVWKWQLGSMLPSVNKVSILTIEKLYYDLELVLPILCLIVTVINQCASFSVLLK